MKIRTVVHYMVT